MMNETNLFEFGDLPKKYYFYRPNQYFSDKRHILCMRNKTLRMRMIGSGTNTCIGVACCSVVLMDGETGLIRGKYSHNEERQAAGMDRL